MGIQHRGIWRQRLLLASWPLVTAALAAGCASDGYQAPASSASVICTQEAPTGSNIRGTRCHRAEDVEARRTLDQETLDRVPNQPYKLPP